MYTGYQKDTRACRVIIQCVPCQLNILPHNWMYCTSWISFGVHNKFLITDGALSIIYQDIDRFLSIYYLFKLRIIGTKEQNLNTTSCNDLSITKAIYFWNLKLDTIFLIEFFLNGINDPGYKCKINLITYHHWETHKMTIHNPIF